MTITDSRPAIVAPKPMGDSPGGEQLAGGQAIPDTQIPRAAGTELTDRPTMLGAHSAGAVGASSRSTKLVAVPVEPASGGVQPAGCLNGSDTHSEGAASIQPTDRRTGTDDHRVFAVGASSRPANALPEPRPATLGGEQLTDRRRHSDVQGRLAVGVEAGRGPAADRHATPREGSLLDPALALAADVLDDIERVRIANANRLQILTRSVEDSDGEVRGFGLDETHPDVARLAAMVAMLGKVEHDAELNLGRMMRRHPLHAWVKAQRGIGDKQGARLLAAIGDPYINSSTGQPRTVSALWAYCGLHVLPASHGVRDAQTRLAGRDQLSADHRSGDAHRTTVGEVGGDLGQVPDDNQPSTAGVAPRRAKGQRANWSTRAKTKAYLVATSCMKQLVKPCAREGDGPAVHVEGCVCSPYRVVYDRRRAHTAVSRPDWSDGHSHNDAVRVAAKAVLRDLWRAAREFHDGPDEG